jgi:hypothetical protein
MLEDNIRIWILSQQKLKADRSCPSMSPSVLAPSKKVLLVSLVYYVYPVI